MLQMLLLDAVLCSLCSAALPDIIKSTPTDLLSGEKAKTDDSNGDVGGAAAAEPEPLQPQTIAVLLLATLVIYLTVQARKRVGHARKLQEVTALNVAPTETQEFQARQARLARLGSGGSGGSGAGGRGTGALLTEAEKEQLRLRKPARVSIAAKNLRAAAQNAEEEVKKTKSAARGKNTYWNGNNSVYEDPDGLNDQ